MQFVYFVSAIHPDFFPLINSTFTFASDLNKKKWRLDWERHLALSQALPESLLEGWGILLGGSRLKEQLGAMNPQGAQCSGMELVKTCKSCLYSLKINVF